MTLLNGGNSETIPSRTCMSDLWSLCVQVGWDVFFFLWDAEGAINIQNPRVFLCPRWLTYWEVAADPLMPQMKRAMSRHLTTCASSSRVTFNLVNESGAHCINKASIYWPVIRSFQCHLQEKLQHCDIWAESHQEIPKAVNNSWPFRNSLL